MEIDYREVGLKAGLEIHQQLNTAKLFCDCPSVLRNDEPKFEIKRSLNPVTGETGKIDVAVEYEKSKNKKFIYQVYDTNCLVETDEEPPHSINGDALKTAVKIALLFDCKIFPVSQVMRKTVIDGSIPSGFQRTVLIGHDGEIETSLGKVRIETIALEEDSGRRIFEDGDEITFRLDRLGIPLVEITTRPDLKTAEQIREAALKIGEILRSCDVRRGIGTIRQDVNISIKGGRRVEIKGFQDPKMMIETIDNEILRQQDCLKENKIVGEVRRANPDGTTSFLRPMPTAARMYPETDVPLLKISREILDDAKKNLPKLEVENKRYLQEFGLNDELIKLVLVDDKTEDFKILSHVIDNPDLIAKSLTLFQKEIARKEEKSLGEVRRVLNNHVIEAVLENVGHKISANDVRTVLQRIVSGKSIDEAMEKSEINLKEEIAKIVKEKPGLSAKAYIGLVMGKFKGAVSGKEVSEELEKILK